MRNINMFREFKPTLLSDIKAEEAAMEGIPLGASVTGIAKISNVKPLVDNLLTAKSQEEAIILIKEEVSKIYPDVRSQIKSMEEDELFDIFSKAICSICRELAEKGLKPEKDCRRVFEWVRSYNISINSSPSTGVH